MIVETLIDDYKFPKGTQFIVDEWEDGFFYGCILSSSNNIEDICCHSNDCKIIQE
jgi:hypothetical protein